MKVKLIVNLAQIIALLVFSREIIVHLVKMVSSIILCTILVKLNVKMDFIKMNHQILVTIVMVLVLHVKMVL